MEKFIVAAIQMDSGVDVEANLKQAALFVEEAAQKGAKLIAMPECLSYIGHKVYEQAENIPYGVSFNLFSSIAKKYKVWLHCGSVYEINPNDKRPYNSTMLINPQGELVAKYHKLHLFDVKINNGPSVTESNTICPGDKIVTVDTGEVGHLGLSICYDIRFCEMFRLMALKGAQIFITPGDFSLATGKDHWEPILKTRAIENGCYVIAPAQIGSKVNFPAYGNTMIIDPWGTVIARAPEKPCVITAEIDLSYLKQVRNQVFTLENRREDVYTLKYRDKKYN